jgi:hypothetical protein
LLVALFVGLMLSTAVAGIGWALVLVGSGTSTFPIQSGAKFTLTNAQISNGTQTNSCTISGNQFTCDLGMGVVQGGTATISLTVQNTGSAQGSVLTESTCQITNSSGGPFNGCSSDGTLTDAPPTVIQPGSSQTLQITFAVSATANTNDTITITSSILGS